MPMRRVACDNLLRRPEPKPVRRNHGESVSHFYKQCGECGRTIECSSDSRLLRCYFPGPCMVTVRNSDYVCGSKALVDGSRCEVRDACTAADHCEAGACVGTAIQEV